MKKFVVASILCLCGLTLHSQTIRTELFHYDRDGIERMMESITEENSSTGTIPMPEIITESNPAADKSGYFVISSCLGCTGPLLGAGIKAFHEYNRHNSWPTSREFLPAELIGSAVSVAIGGYLAFREPYDRKSALGIMAGSLLGTTLALAGLLLLN